MAKCFLFVLGVLFSQCAFAQLSIDNAKRFLTNGAYRDWKLGNYKPDLGPAACSGDGQIFEFVSNGKLVWKKCKNGISENSTLTWTIEPVANSIGEYSITFSRPVQFTNDGPAFHSLNLFFDTPKIKAKNKILTLKSSRQAQKEIVHTYSLVSVN